MGGEGATGGGDGEEHIAGGSKTPSDAIRRLATHDESVEGCEVSVGSC